MEVEARNKQEVVSEDSIRRDKGEWNDAVQLLVAKLLAFKRGLNGVGDDRAKLPPVDMSDPFPTEMAIYLNSIADDYVAIVDGAKDIMSDQRENSSKSAGEELNHQLIVEASWWGSRTWARLGLLGLGDQRKIRIKMLAFANESVHDLYNIENDLLNSAKLINPDPNGVAKAINKMLKLMNDYNNSFVPQYNALMAEMQAAETKKFGPKKLKEEPKEEPVELHSKPYHERSKTEPSNRIEETRDPPPDEVYKEKAPKSTGVEVALNYIKKEMKRLESRKNKLRNAKSVSVQEKVALETAYSNFISSLSKFNASPLNQNENAPELVAAFNTFANKVKDIKGAYYASWKDVDADADMSAISYKLSKEEIVKLTHNTFTRYMNRAIMGLSDNKLKVMKTNVVNILLETYKAFDELMNRLEERSTTTNSLSAAFLKVSSLLADANKKLWPIGKNYILSQDERNRATRQKGKKDIEQVRMLKERELKELGGYSNRILGQPEKEKEKTPKEIKNSLNLLKSEIEPIFNDLNVNMHPGGIMFDVKQLTQRDSNDTVIGIVIRPNTYIKQQQAAQQSSDPNTLVEWQSVKNYLNSKFKERLKKKYKDRLDYPVTVHILE